MLSRATAALKARVTNLEVPWSSQGWMEQGLGARAKRSRTAERPGKALPFTHRHHHTGVVVQQSEIAIKRACVLCNGVEQAPQ